jgi:uncharacterized protein (TIGR03084 family)
MEQAADFRDEGAALYELLRPLDEADFEQATLFKGWTIEEIVRHLHFWNRAAGFQLTDTDALARILAAFAGASGNMRTMEAAELGGLSGRALLAAWRETALEIADRFSVADPKARLKWAGPEMSARSSITARLMETWAHGQAIYDVLGVERVNADRIRNIAHLGVGTFAWTYAVRKMPVPEKSPHVRLTAPSGAVWTWGEPDAESAVVGDATEFCQVVTQVRNIADTRLACIGPVAVEWMSMAQCFAGRAEPPPAPGTRFRRNAALS